MREGSAFQARRVREGQKVQKDAQVEKDAQVDMDAQGDLDAQVDLATPARKVGLAILAARVTEDHRVMSYTPLRRVMRQTTPIWAIEAQSPNVPLHCCARPLQGILNHTLNHRGNMHR